MSVRCNKCGLFNSFSFKTNQIKCIKCSSSLYEQDIQEAKYYQTNLSQRDFKNLNNTWNNTEDTSIIKDTVHV